MGAQQALMNNMTSSDVISQPTGPKLSPMLPLAVMEDEDVFPFIQREFARVPAPPTRTQMAQQRALKSSSVLRRPSTGSQSKQETAYRQALMASIHRICTQAFGLPRYFTNLVFKKLASDTETAEDRAQGSTTAGLGLGITALHVKEFYEKHLRFKSIVRRMFETLLATSKGRDSQCTEKRNVLVRDDFQAYLEVLLEMHPGLSFLRQTLDFQTKYTETVIIRIFYDLDRFDRGRISWSEFENSKLPDAFRQVDATDDINTVLNYFSYEHFYVLYCRFWELDEDRDMLISQQDLQKYSPDGTMNPKIVERVFQGHGRRLTCKVKGKMNYEDFVWFCLSEEDKSNPRAIAYWFRVLDLDGDGYLSGFELEAFYSFTKKQLMQLTTEGIAFPDVICQVSDMLPFSVNQGIRLRDLLAAPQAAFVALNMIMSVVKFLQFEQRDPFVAHHDRVQGGFERNDWDRFARAEYDRMAQEADGEN
jgi:serine/threonine-protein phosphatase 2A regulatory subunit B''